LIDDTVTSNARTRTTTRTNRNAPTAKERKKRQWRKNIIRIATWNTRSWNNKAQEILIELNHKTIDICAISETNKKKRTRNYPLPRLYYVLQWRPKGSSCKGRSWVSTSQEI